MTPSRSHRLARRQIIKSTFVLGAAGILVPGFARAATAPTANPWRDNVTLLGWYPDDPGTDEGLAVDDLTVTFVPLVRDFGVDVSHFRGESGVPQSSWDQMFAEGKRLVFIKAPEGLTGPHDPAMSNNVTRATAAGLLGGVYHFAHPENRPTPAGAVLEASNFVVYAGTAIGSGRLRPVIDLERGANLTTTELTDWVIAFCEQIVCYSEFKPLSSFIIPNSTSTSIQLTGMTMSLGGAFEINFTNTPGTLGTVLSTTNVFLPASEWTILGPVTEVSPGQFRFIDTNAPTFPTRFYRVLFL